MEKEGNWYKVLCKDGTEAFVYSSLVQVSPPASLSMLGNQWRSDRYKLELDKNGKPISKEKSVPQSALAEQSVVSVMREAIESFEQGGLTSSSEQTTLMDVDSLVTKPSDSIEDISLGMGKKAARGGVNLVTGIVEVPMQIYKGYNAGADSSSKCNS